MRRNTLVCIWHLHLNTTQWGRRTRLGVWYVSIHLIWLDFNVTAVSYNVNFEQFLSLHSWNSICKHVQAMVSISWLPVWNKKNISLVHWFCTNCQMNVEAFLLRISSFFYGGAFLKIGSERLTHLQNNHPGSKVCWHLFVIHPVNEMVIFLLVVLNLYFLRLMHFTTVNKKWTLTYEPIAYL